MPEYLLKSEKSTLRFLTNVLRLAHQAIADEFGPELSKNTKIELSRKMYFTLGRCWPERPHIAYNLAWIVLNRDKPEAVRALVLHEVCHLGDRTHGAKFGELCQKFQIETSVSPYDPPDFSGSQELPPISWIICMNCGDYNGLVFSTRLTTDKVKEKLTGIVCRTCGKELEYRELSDRSFKNFSAKLKKLRLYNTKTWESLKAMGPNKK
jgi:predicted SprT family Zn-dependent metalloprotease